MAEIVVFGESPRPDNPQLFPCDQVGVEWNHATIRAFAESQEGPVAAGRLPASGYRLWRTCKLQNDVGTVTTRRSIQN